MDDSLETFVPLAFRRKGARRVVTDDRHVHDVTLLEGLARGFYWQQLVDTGAMESGSDIARAEDLHPSVPNELMRLTLLAPDIIERLMCGDFDVVVPLVLQRNHPHRTVLYNADGSPYEFDPACAVPFKVDLAGSAGMLIREHVLRAIGDPWFRIAGTERQSEDIGFCQAVARAGFRIWCNPTVTMGHIASVEVWPDRNEATGQLRVAYRQPNMARLR